MHRAFGVALLSLAGLAALNLVNRADAIAIKLPAGPEKVGQADLIVSGKVTSIEDKMVEATPNAFNQNKVEYKVAVITVTEVFKGDAKIKTVRVGFIAPKVIVPPGGPVPPGGIKPLPGPGIQPVPAPRFPPIKGGFNMQLSVGQTGMFYLSRHHSADFYIMPMFGTFVTSENNPNYAKEVDTTKKTLKVVQNPIASLKAEKAEDRLEAAYYLITMYRTGPFGAPSKEEPIKAEESQQILKTLLEADWDPVKYQNNYQHNPAQLFNRLNISQQDGWTPPQGVGWDTPAYINAAKNWLSQNWQNYQIKRFVATKVQPGAGVPLLDGPGIKPLPGGGPVIQPLPVQPGGPGLQPLPIQPNPGVLPAQPGNIQILPGVQPVPQALPR